MRVVIQRSGKASVISDRELTGEINSGLVILVGFEQEDNREDVDWMVRKVLNLRIFNDEEGVMNRSILDVDGEILLISQFTLHASTKKGNRPSYIRAARPEQAIPLYEYMISRLETETGKNVAKGVFGADMKVSLVNDGPVTIWIDSRNKE